MFNCFLAEQRKYRPVTTVCQQGGREVVFLLIFSKSKGIYLIMIYI